MNALLPSDEAERLKALAGYKILDTEAERNFDDITLLASHICRTPIALISLVDENRQWFKSKVGMIESETSRDIAFCAHGILEPDMFEVEDALADERFATNPLVTGNPKIRFYAGSPLMTPDGYALGMLCVIDQVPRELSPSERAALKALSRQVVAQLELRRTLAERKQADQALRESEARTRVLVKSSNVGLWDWNLRTNEVFYSPEWKSQLGYTDDELPNRYEEWENRLHPEDREASFRAVKDFREGRRADYDIEFRLRHKDGSWRSILTRADLIHDATGQPVRMLGCHIDITTRKQTEEALRESQHTIRLTLEAAHIGHWDLDLVTHKATRSLQHDQIFGYGELLPDWSYESFLTCVHPEDREDVDRLFQAGVAAKTSWDFECRIVRRDGALRWIWAHGNVFTNAAGEAVRMLGMVRDITQRKTIEVALKSAEEQYRSIFENAVDGIFRTSPDGEFLIANPAAARIFGFTSPDELIGERRDIARQGYVDPRRREEFKRLLQEQGVVNGFEYEAYRKDGSRVWICENTRAIHSPSGELLYFEGIFEDVTDRKRAEEKLWESLTLLRAIMEGTTDAIYAKDREGRYLMINSAGARFLGKTPEEVIGLDDTQLFSGETRTRIVERDRCIMETGETRTDEDFTLSKANVPRIYLSTKGPLRDSLGAITGLFGVSRDITKQKREHEKLRESETRFRQLAENIDEVFWITDREGSKTIYISPAYERIWGRSCESLYATPKAWRDAIHPEDRPRMAASLPSDFGSTADNTYRIVRPDGSIRWIHDRGFPVRDESGRLVRIAGIAQDITDQKEVAEALRSQALRYKTLMETSTDSIYVLDEKGDLQEANAAFFRLHGYTAAEVKGLSVADWDARGTREQLQASLRKLADGGAVFETRHRCRDGSIFDVEVCATSVRIGEEQLFFCVTRDITARKKAESALRQLAQVSAASSDYIALIGRDFRYQFVNDTYLKARGLHLEDMIGHHMKEIVGQERFEQLGRPQVEACLRGEEVESFEWTDFGSDLRCFLHVKVAPLRKPDGTISGAVMSGRDITARYEAEQAQRESEERFRELAENINEVFWVWTATPGNARCLYVSPAYAAIWGRSCESLYSSPQSWMEALHPQDKERGLEEGARLDFEKISDWTYRIVRPDQSIRWIRDRIFPVRDEGGVVVRFAGIAEDITERKHAEAALGEVARQQAAVAELGKLALTGGEPQELFDRAAAMVAETLEVEYCQVLQLLPDHSAMKLVAGVGWKEGLVGQATAGVAHDSQAGYTLLTKGLVIVEDLRTEKRFNGPPLLREHGVVSGLSAIIGEIEKPFGVMGAHTTRQRTFTIADGHFFQSIANVLAEAIQRKRAEKAMQESERKYRELVELSHDLVWAVDQEGRITYMSPASRHIYGREPEEMVGHLFTDFMAPDEARRSVDDLAKMIATGDSVLEVEARLLHRDGHEIVLSTNAMVLRDPAGNIVGTTGTSRDVTERKRAEEALRESEQRFRELAENIHEVFWMSDPENTRMIYVSPAYETIWGRRRETLYSSPASWMDAIHPDDTERMVRTRANRDPAFPHDNTYRIVRPDGSVRWIRDRGFPVRDERRVVVRFAGIAEDITERKQTAEAQERALSLTLATLESTADGILVVNTEGKIVTFNRLFARMWRLSDEVLAPKEDARALDCVLDQLNEPTKFLEKVRYLYQHSEEESFDRLVFKDGRVFERYSRPQFIGGRVAGRVWSFRDATERTQAAKELEEANDQLRLLSRRLFDAHEEERRHLARELHDEIGQALTAAKINLDSIESIESSAQSLRLKETSTLLDNLLRQVRQISLDLHSSLLDDLGLAPALRSLLDQQARRAGLRAQFFAIEPLEDIDPEIQTTGFRIAQEAITNVLRHAKALSVGVYLQTEAGLLQLKIVDDGGGFDLAEIEGRAQEEASFGLIGMRERAALVGGRVRIISSPNEGTTVQVSLPLHASDEKLRSTTP